MNRQLFALTVVLLASCAAPQPTPQTAPGSAIESAAPAAEAEIARADPADSGLSGDIEAAEPLAPTPTAVVHPASPDTQVICKLERRTGSNRKIKICRRPPTTEEAANTRETFESLRRSQQQPY